MAARTKVHLLLPGGEVMLARTDLHGHGNVNEGEEFVAREMWPQGHGLILGGRWLRVRARRTEKVSKRHQLLHVDILEDKTRPPERQADLFGGSAP